MAERIIAVDIDDTLNNFSQTLRETDFAYHPRYALGEERFHELLAKVKAGHSEPTELLSTEYSYFKAQIHLQIYERGQARPDAVEFMQDLRASGWTIVICTYRDLRRSSEITRAWLRANGIPFDYLFRANNKIVFCRSWGIRYLIDDDPLNITHGGVHGVDVFYPAGLHAELDPHPTARSFLSFREVRQWIGN